jgi:hypothetical protein
MVEIFAVAGGAAVRGLQTIWRRGHRLMNEVPPLMIDSDAMRPEAGLARRAIASVLSPPAGSKTRTVWTDVAYVVSHAANLCPLAAILLLSVMWGSASAIFAALLIECLIIAVVATSPRARRAIAAKAQRVERERMRERRAAAIAQIADSIHARLFPVAVGSADLLGLDRMAASYLRLAVLHRRAAESVAKTNRAALEAAADALEAERDRAASPARQIVERRRTIVAMRAECWERTREAVELIGHQLSTIVEMVRLIHERLALPSEMRSAREDVDAFLAELDQNEEAAGSLADLGVLDVVGCGSSDCPPRLV